MWRCSSVAARSARVVRWLLVLAMVVVPFVFFSSGLRPHQDRVTSSLQEIVYPFEYAMHASAAFIARIWHGYIDLRRVAADNARLKLRVVELQTKLQLYEEKEAESRRLRALLGLSRSYAVATVTAEVVAKAGSFPFLAVRVNRGRQAEIAAGMPVIGAAGVVGRVLRVGHNYADVQLLVDSGFYLDILVQRTRVRGLLRGNLRNCILQMPQEAELRIGDTIVTSGLTGSFPKGVLVGRVVRISYEANRVTQQITVEPAIDHRQLEEVSILQQRAPSTQRIVAATRTPSDDSP